MSAQENKAIIRQWVDHWNTRNLEAWINTVDPQCTFPVLAASGATPTLDGYKQFCMALLDAFPDWNETIEEIVAEDELVIMGVPTFFPPRIPAKAPARSRTGLNEAGSPVAWQQRKRYSRPFSLKK